MTAVCFLIVAFIQLPWVLGIYPSDHLWINVAAFALNILAAGYFFGLYSNK